MVFSDPIPFHRPSLLLSCFAEDPNHLGASPTSGRLYGYCWLECSKGCFSQYLQGFPKVLRSNSQHSSSALDDWKTPFQHQDWQDNQPSSVTQNLETKNHIAASFKVAPSKWMVSWFLCIFTMEWNSPRMCYWSSWVLRTKTNPYSTH